MDYSLRIEKLLCKISPTQEGRQAEIRNKPYEIVIEVLSPRISTYDLEGFETEYGHLLGKSVADIVEKEIESFIASLKTLINKQEEK